MICALFCQPILIHSYLCVHRDLIAKDRPKNTMGRSIVLGLCMNRKEPISWTTVDIYIVQLRDQWWEHLCELSDTVLHFFPRSR